jgi:hypothetical protein
VNPFLYRKGESSNPPLRVGLLLDTPSLARCFAEVVDHIAQSDFAALELVVFNADAQNTIPASQQTSKARKLWKVLRDSKRRSKILFALYERWDRGHIDPATDPLHIVDCSARLEQIESLSVSPITKRFVHRFPPEAIERIRAKELDVLIRFGFNILRGDILNSAKYGVWSYHHGDNDFYRGGPAYFWEMCEGNSLSGAILQVLTEELDAGKVLYKGVFASYPGLSAARNRVMPYWGASTFMIQKLRELHGRGWQSLERNMIHTSPYQGKKKIYTQPANGEMLRWFVPVLFKKTAKRLIRKSCVPHWRLAIRKSAKAIADLNCTSDLNGFQWVEAPKGRFYADPFLIEEGENRPFAFFEDYDYSTRRGKISCAELRNGTLTSSVTALERPYHLSYPCIFRDGKTLYMIPESSSNGTVELYVCEEFPNVWKFRRELFRTHAVDTTIHVQDGMFWLFMTLLEPKGLATQLWLFYSHSPEGAWIPHPVNPISTDVRNSRGAGAIFWHNGKLIRPSQDCSKAYGRAFTLNEIVLIDPCHYQEKPCVSVEPVWAKHLIGTHTYARSGDLEIIDGCTLWPESRVKPK